MARVLVQNILNFFALLGLILVMPPVLHFVYVSLLGKSSEVEVRDIPEAIKPYDHKSVFADYKWAEEHFREFGSLTTQYEDYITWRREDFKGSTINISNGVRVTPLSNESISSSRFWFFGGSTTWGTGVADSFTYVALFNQLFGSIAVNYGETAYIARQSLSYLQNIFIKAKDNKNYSGVQIVFFDGVNDVAHRCRTEINGLSTGRQQQIRNALNAPDFDRYSFKRTFAQLLDVLAAIKSRVYGTASYENESISGYNCSANPDKALEVASTLIETWLAADQLASSHGAKFTAILQPVAFIGTPQVDYLDLTDKQMVELSAEYKAVYPIVLELVKNTKLHFVDMTSIYDGCANCYFDFCHVGPFGNMRIAKELGTVFAPITN